MKKLIAFLAGFLVNCLVGGAFAACLGFNPIVGACALNGVAAIAPCFDNSEGARMSAYATIWEGELLKAFRTETRGWLAEIRSYDKLVSDNQTINFVDLGGDPEVLINNTTYPLEVTELEDGDVAIKLDKYQTKPTKVTDDEAIGLEYDKKATVIERHKESVDETKYKKALHALAPTENTAETPILVTTGPDNGFGRKRMVVSDIIALKAKLDDMKMPSRGRILVLSTTHANDLLVEDADFFTKMHDVTTGKLRPIYGFKIYEDSDTPLFEAASLKKSAYNVIGDSTRHSASSILFYAPKMMKAKGATRHYLSEPNPITQEWLFSLRHNFICLPISTKKTIGAIISATA